MGAIEEQFRRMAFNLIARHQMSVNGKRTDFVINDLLQCADAVSMQTARGRSLRTTGSS